MYLKRKLDELLAFLDKTKGISTNARMTVEEYVHKWGEDLRAELGLSFHVGGVIGISFDADLQLKYMPQVITVRNGLYTSYDGKIKVEVIDQEPLTGMVHMEMTTHDAPEGRLEVMSANLFIFFFVSNDVIAE